ncbi:unnamed protein product [Parajaminaea phylloscopi]
MNTMPVNGTHIDEEELATNAAGTSTAPAPNGVASATASRERFPEPPKDLLSVLQTFMETQQRRVSHWKEYDEAIEEHLKHVTKERVEAGTRTGTETETEAEAETATESEQDRPLPSTTDADHQSNGIGNSSHAHSHGHPHSHYDSTRLPLDDELMSRIISLVTSGLLDCGHETRAIAVELAHNTAWQQQQQDTSSASVSALPPSPSSSSSTPTPSRAREMSRLVGQVQDRENEVLRKVVQRDQLRRVRARRSVQQRQQQQQQQRQVEGDNSVAQPIDADDDDDERIEALDTDIAELRAGPIAELLEEIRAEMAELAAGS